MTFICRTLTALALTTTIAAAAPRAAAPTTVQQTGVHKTLNRLEKGALKHVFGDQKAFARKLARAMSGDAVVASPR